VGEDIVLCRGKGRRLSRRFSGPQEVMLGVEAACPRRRHRGASVDCRHDGAPRLGHNGQVESRAPVNT
jgi:hypothetical protein